MGRKGHPLEKDDWKKIVKNILTIVLNVSYAKNEKIYPAYVWKHNSNCERKQVNLLMNPNGKGWHYLATKNYLHSNLFFPGTICAGLTAKLPSIANISKMVRVNIVFTTTFLKKYLISLLMTCRLIDFSIRIL